VVSDTIVAVVPVTTVKGYAVPVCSERYTL
jgi:hypothetical protein